MYKKLLLCFSIVTLACFGLCGCAGKGSTPSVANSQNSSLSTANANNDNSAKDSDSDESDAPTVPDNISGGKLTVWCWDKKFNVYSMKEAEKFYNKAHPNNPVTLDIVEKSFPDIQKEIIKNVKDKTLNKLPDILLMEDMAFQKNCVKYPEIFTNLDNSGIKFDDFSQSKVDFSTYNGKHYGVPFDNGTAIMAVRKDIIAKAGYYMWDMKDLTWQKFLKIAKKVKEKTGKPMLSIPDDKIDLPIMMLQTTYTGLFNPDGSPNIKGNKNLEYTMKIYKTMVKKGYLKITHGWDGYVKSINDGDVACVINGCWVLGSIRGAKSQAKHWQIVNLPRLFDTIPTSTNYASNGGSSWVVTSQAKNKVLAMAFLRDTFASSKEFYNAILPLTGAISTYIPARSGKNYMKAQLFFNNQLVFNDILDYSKQVPSVSPGIYFFEARDALAKGLKDYINGENLHKVLDNVNNEILRSIEKK